MDAVIPENAAENIPENIQLVYWDYYHEDQQFYSEYIKRHQKLSRDMIFAGGIWTWLGPGTNYGKTFATTNAALSACKKQGVKEVIATIWMDNGAENNFYTALLGLQLFAEHGYAAEVSTDRLMKRFDFCTNGNYDAFMDLKYLDETPGSLPENLETANPSKFLLWQDFLCGLFDRHVEGLDLENHYTALEKKMSINKGRNKDWEYVFDVAEKLCSVLSMKSQIGLLITDCYKTNNLEGLRDIVFRMLPEVKDRIEKLRISHRNQWFNSYKPQGWEILDIRYGGLLTRADTAIKRISDYLDGFIERIEELDEEKLYFDGYEGPRKAQLCQGYEYYRIISASPI